MRRRAEHCLKLETTFGIAGQIDAALEVRRPTIRENTQSALRRVSNFILDDDHRRVCNAMDIGGLCVRANSNFAVSDELFASHHGSSASHDPLGRLATPQDAEPREKPQDAEPRGKPWKAAGFESYMAYADAKQAISP